MNTPFIRNTPYTDGVTAVVLDWAGTAVDHGCMGPAAVFADVFEAAGVPVSMADARRFMGLAKKEHIRSMCALPTVAEAWKSVHGRLPDASDVDRLYEDTFVRMVDSIGKHADPIPGIVEMARALRDRGIKIGSCTGYVTEMMAVLVPRAREQGYHPDAVFCSSDAPAGRPFPWMCYLNAVALQTYPMESMVKVGDTVTDIEEGLNAGMWTVGITRTGNEMGLTLADLNALDPGERSRRIQAIDDRFKAAGAHYTLETAADLLPVIDQINQRLARGEQPLS